MPRKPEQDFKQKVFDRAFMLALQRKAVIKALKDGSRRCSHNEHMRLSRDENNHYVSFLQELTRALAALAVNPKKCDAGFHGFLPTGTMREIFRDMGVVSTSDFIQKPLVAIQLRLTIHGMHLPTYVAYLHPDYECPDADDSKP